jgi:hypothetical protein
MSQKARKPSKTENISLESGDANIESAESIQAVLPGGAIPFDTNRQEERGTSSAEDSFLSTTAEDDVFPDDLLKDMRHSLIEEESAKTEKESTWWHRLAKKKKGGKQDQPMENVEIELARLPNADGLVEAQQQDYEPEAQYPQDDLVDLFATETQATSVASAPTPKAEELFVPKPEIDFESLRDQAFRPHTSRDGLETPSDVRSIALSDGEESFVEVQSQGKDPLEERMSAVKNALKPYQWHLNLALAIFAVVVVVIVSLIAYSIYKQSQPHPEKVASPRPYPITVSLPGGWSFEVDRGTIQNGMWDPRGAEWLEGTEVSRWIALPWSIQLEAVVRTLKPKDQILLVMSNNDRLIYQVHSVQELTFEEMQGLDASTPSLLLILTGADSEKHWVLTAMP